MTDADLLECAARLAERQPDAPAAIRAALSFTDRYPGALRATEAEAGISLALTLGRSCARRDDVARFFRQAASHGAAS